MFFIFLLFRHGVLLLPPYLPGFESPQALNIFSNFHGFMPDANYKHLESFVKLGTHSEPRRGEMSHICDISLLRVKVQNFIESKITP